MKLILQNGYPYPYPDDATPEVMDELANDATRNTLVLEGVIGFEWLHTITVEFKDRDQSNLAKGRTGWGVWRDLVLEAPTSSPDGYGHPAIIAGNMAYCGFILVEDDHG